MAARQVSARAKSKRVFGQPQAPAKMFRVGLYARVSTHDQQTLPLQIRAMREYAAKRGWTIAAQIKEVGSGAAQRELRATLIAAARGARLMSCWFGDWIAGADPSRIWFRRSRNCSISVWPSCR